MNKRIYTDNDLRAEAARQHAELTQDPDFMGIGEQMEGKIIPSTFPGESATRETLAASKSWNQLDEDEYDHARKEIHDLITGAADLSRWAVDMGADGLEPDQHVIITEAGKIRIYFALAPDLPDEPRAAFLSSIAKRKETGSAVEGIRPYDRPVHGDRSEGYQMGWDACRTAFRTALGIQNQESDA